MTNTVEFIRSGGSAPLMQKALGAITDLLADGEWHSYREVQDAMVEAGVVLRTAQNLMRDAGKCDPPVIERRRTERGWECRRASTTARPRKL